MTRSGNVDASGRRDEQSDGPLRHVLHLGRWAGVPISANWSVAATLILFTWLLATGVLPSARPGHAGATYWLTGLLTTVILLGTLLAHELAHALCARRYGLRVRRIVLWMLGGMTEYDGVPPTPRAEAWIALAGPLTNIVLGIVFAAVNWMIGAPGLLGTALLWLAGVSVLLGVFNLLPGAPLDGGRLLRALLWRRYGDRARASDGAARAGRVLGWAFVAFGLAEAIAGGVDGLWLTLIGWFVLSGAAAERSVAGLDAVRDVTVAEIMTPTPLTAPGWWTVQAFLDQVSPDWVRQPVIPVVDFTGAAVGLTVLTDLQRVPVPRRTELRVRDVARHATTVPVTATVGDLLPMVSRGLAIVVDEHGPIGLVSSLELTRAAQLTELGWHRPGHRDAA